MGRPERALDPGGGPVMQLARDLRQLRWSAGLTYRELAVRTHYSHSALSRAADGTRVPCWDLTKAFVSACGQDPSDWFDRWTAATADGVCVVFFSSGSGKTDSISRLSHSRLNDQVERSWTDTGVTVDVPDSPHAVAQALRGLRRRYALEQNTPELSLRQIAANTNRSRSVIADYFSGTRLPPADTFDAIIQLLGATADEQRVLADARDQIEEDLQTRRQGLLDGQRTPPPSEAVTEPTHTEIPTRPVATGSHPGFSESESAARVRSEISQLFATTSADLFAYALMITRNSQEEAGDLVQDAYRCAIGTWSELRGKPLEEQRSWLRRVAQKTAIDRWRKGRRERDLIEQLSRDRPKLPHEPSESVIPAIMLEQLWKHIQALPLQPHRVALLYWRAGWTVSEVAKHLNMSSSTVRGHIKTVRDTMVAEISQDEPEGRPLGYERDTPYL